MNQLVQRTNFKKIGTINYAKNQTIREQLPISGKVRRLMFELNITNTITDSTNGVVVARSPLSIVSSMRIIADRDITLKEGRLSDFKDRMYVTNKLPAETQDTVANNATTVKSRVLVNFVTPGSVRGVDTVLDMNRHQRLDLEMTFGDQESIVANCDDASTDPTGTIDVLAEVSNYDPAPNGYFIERGFETSSLGTSANTALEIPLTRGPRQNYHHIILLAEDLVANSGRTLVSTALNSIRIDQQGAGGLSTPFGPVSGDELQHEFDLTFDREGVQTGIYPIVFQPRFDGRQTFNLTSGGLNDLKLLINHDAFTTAGYIRVLQGTVEPILLS